MKRPIFTAILATLLVAPLSADAISGYQKTSYSDGGLTLRMAAPAGSVFNPGETLSFRYQTLEDAYVIVFNIDTEGYVHLLSPIGTPVRASARRDYAVPANRSDALVVSGETGIEFVFALSVPNRDYIDEEQLNWLLASEGLPRSEQYRIEGDPFIAANMVAGELVRGISRRQGIFLDYTYFFINQRVDYPCYLCGECDIDGGDSICDNARVVADFALERPLRYPMPQAYALVDQDVPYNAPAVAAVEGEGVIDEGQAGVDVIFYPYATEVRYINRPWYGYDWYWYDPWYYDPWCSGWSYYPVAYPGRYWSSPYYNWYFSVGWNWGWGCGYWGGGWGGYWCSDYYYPRHHRGYRDYYGPSRPLRRFKDDRVTTAGALTPVKGRGSLANARSIASRRDATQRVASGAVRVKTRDGRIARGTTVKTRDRFSRTRDYSDRRYQRTITRLKGSGTRTQGITRGGTRTRTTGPSVFPTRRVTRGSGPSITPQRRSTRDSAIKRGTTRKPTIRSRGTTPKRSFRSKSSTTRKRGSAVKRSAPQKRSSSKSVKRSSSRSSSSRKATSSKRSSSSRSSKSRGSKSRSSKGGRGKR